MQHEGVNMTLGSFVKPLASRAQSLATNTNPLGDPNGASKRDSILADAISNAPTRFAQGEKIGQDRLLRNETKKEFQREATSPSDRLRGLGEAAGRAGDIGKAGSLTEASGSSKRSESSSKFKDLSNFTGLIQSAYKSELKKTSDPDKALAASNKLLASLNDSGLGDEIRPALQFFADSEHEFDLGGDDVSGRDVVVGATKEGQAVLVNKITGKSRLVTDDDGNQIMKFVSPELQRAKTTAQEEAKQQVTNTALGLKNKGLVPASVAYLNNPIFKDRIIKATDTGEEFIELRKVPIASVKTITGLQDMQNRLRLATQKLIDYGVETDPITGRIPLIGEFLVEANKDPKFKEIRADFGRLLDPYRTQVTGAAAGNEELERIKAKFPNMENWDIETLMRMSMSVFNETENSLGLLIGNLEKTAFDIGDIKRPPQVLNLEIPESERESASEKIIEFGSDIKNTVDEIKQSPLGQKIKQNFKSQSEVNERALELGLKKGDIVTINDKDYVL